LSCSSKQNNHIKFCRCDEKGEAITLAELHSAVWCGREKERKEREKEEKIKGKENFFPPTKREQVFSKREQVSKNKTNKSENLTFTHTALGGNEHVAGWLW